VVAADSGSAGIDPTVFVVAADSGSAKIDPSLCSTITLYPTATGSTIPAKPLKHLAIKLTAYLSSLGEKSTTTTIN
jgi:hypothetical protein